MRCDYYGKKELHNNDNNNRNETNEIALYGNWEKRNAENFSLTSNKNYHNRPK